MIKTALGLARLLVEKLEEKKAQEINIFNTRKHTPLFDYAVICTANSSVQAQALGEYLKEQLKKEKIVCLNMAGLAYGDWVLLDFGLVVVHIFLPQARDYYRLEQIWNQSGKISR